MENLQFRFDDESGKIYSLCFLVIKLKTSCKCFTIKASQGSEGIRFPELLEAFIVKEMEEVIHLRLTD